MTYVGKLITWGKVSQSPWFLWGIGHLSLWQRLSGFPSPSLVRQPNAWPCGENAVFSKLPCSSVWRCDKLLKHEKQNWDETLVCFLKGRGHTILCPFFFPLSENVGKMDCCQVAILYNEVYAMLWAWSNKIGWILEDGGHQISTPLDYLPPILFTEITWLS